MEPEEFADAWEGLLAKLSPLERELIEATVSGAEVNHCLAYVVFAFVLGALGGWAACALA